ncbi:serine hydrolase [Micromonospora sp. IBHARD004]|uniref:serine hydrolase n=1 Tax=Micromonospora sp. IBHARD004 TaxID=3457764 RepID=UPI004059F1B4
MVAPAQQHAPAAGAGIAAARPVRPDLHDPAGRRLHHARNLPGTPAGGTTRPAYGLRHALTHTAGVPALPADVTPAGFADWERMCALVAAARPRWAPGELVAVRNRLGAGDGDPMEGLRTLIRDG